MATRSVHALPDTGLQYLCPYLSGADERFGKHLYETIWPYAQQADGQKVDLSIIRSAKQDAATKVFTTKLTEGYCGFECPDTGDFLKMNFPVDKVPYVGIWINEGGFFEGKGSFNMALEPCTGCPDKLETAIQRGEHALIKGGAKNSWSLDINHTEPMVLEERAWASQGGFSKEWIPVYLSSRYCPAGYWSCSWMSWGFCAEKIYSATWRT